MRTHLLAALALSSLTAMACDSTNPGQHLPSSSNMKLPPPPPQAEREPLDPGLRRAAEAELALDASGDDPVLRANALEAYQKTSGPAQQAKMVAALTDPDPMVRFAASMAVGTLRLKVAEPRLQSMAEDPDPAVRVGVRFALHRLGDTRLSHQLEQSSQDPDPSVRADTALALGLLEEPTGLVVLRPMRSDAVVPVRIQVLESMWRLGDTSARDKLVTGTISKYPDDAIVCLLALAAPKDRSIIRYLRAQLTNDYVETKLAAARAVGMLGSDDGLEVALDAVGSPDPRQRALAALAIGAIGRTDSQSRLRKLLDDKVASVRLAAATAVLQLKN